MEGQQKLVSVKCFYEEDIRRISCPVPNLNALRTTVLQLYGLESNPRFVLKYKDEEGDLVTLATDNDLYEARKNATTLLKIHVIKTKQHEHRAARAPVAVVGAITTATTQDAASAPAPTGVAASTPREHGCKHHKEEKWRMWKKEKKEHGCHHEKREKLCARFVKDVGLPEDSEVLPGTSFVKGWRFRNEGDQAWPQGCTLIFIAKLSGDQMGAPASVPVTAAGVGEEVEVIVPMVAPANLGRYVGYWRLCTADGKKFGQRVRALIQVVASESSSPTTSSSSDSEEDEKETAALAALTKMGFSDQKLNAKVLRKCNGDLQSAITRLTHKQEKRLKKQEKKAAKAEKKAMKADKKAEKKEKKAEKSAHRP